jgi:hypothetical protein
VDELSVCEAAGAGFDGGGVCCAAHVNERKLTATKVTKRQVTDFIDKHLS